MAHMIDISTGRAAFAFSAKDGVAWWEGLQEKTDNGTMVTLKGIELPNDRCDVQTAATAAGLRWSPWEERLFTHDGKPMGLKAIRRNDNNAVLGHARLGYTTVPHSLHLASIAGPMLAMGGRWSSLGAIMGGSRYFASLTCDAWKAQHPDGSEVNRYLTLVSGYGQQDDNLGMGLHTLLGETRVVCRNTMNIALAEGGANVALRHTTGVYEAMANVGKAIAKATVRFAKLDACLKALHGRKVTDEDVKKVLTKLYPAPAPKAKASAQAPVVAKPVDTTDLIGSILDQVNPIGTDTRLIASVVDETNDWQTKPIQKILEAYEAGPGASPGNAYGLLQAVTHYETQRADAVTNMARNDEYALDVLLDVLQVAR